MKIWESGRATEHIQSILQGNKTVEGRLNKGKFAQYQPGDTIYLREDVYDEFGNLIDSKPKRAKVKIQKIEKYKCFSDMLESVGIQNVLPNIDNIPDGVTEYRKFYSVADENKFGVLAVHIELMDAN